MNVYLGLCIALCIICLGGLTVYYKNYLKYKRKIREQNAEYTFICGHKAKLNTVISIFGSEGSYNVPAHKAAEAHCPDCFARAAIKCAWCGKAIVPDDPITLYTPTQKDYKIPEHAVIYKKDPLQLVGCFRMSCAEGIDRAGFWIMPGKVKRVVSPAEQLFAAAKEGKDEVMIFRNLRDQTTAIEINDD